MWSLLLKLLNMVLLHHIAAVMSCKNMYFFIGRLWLAFVFFRPTAKQDFSSKMFPEASISLKMQQKLELLFGACVFFQNCIFLHFRVTTQ